jgi:HD-GYP domain-containing protein (c-di-GMP phosphodiesterase class II)
METQQTVISSIERLTEIGTALSSERNLDALLEKILLAAKEITCADGGTVYLVNPGKTHLQFSIVRTESLGIALGGTSGKPITGLFPDLPLFDAQGKVLNRLIATHSANTGKTVNVADAYEVTGFDMSGTHAFDGKTGYRSQSLLTVPMKNHEDDLIGVLQLLNATDPATGNVRSFSAPDQKLAESLASQAAVALTNRQLIQQLADLFESFISMVNVAIDEKSPYTGGHCARVPALTEMLAQAVNHTQSGPLAGILLSESDMYELRIAALLHDCGKITTPVHVVDKATKLETIFDRVELIRTRAELIRRETEAKMWKGIASGELEAQAGQDSHRLWCEQLDSDLQFLVQCNTGSERMRDGDVERIAQIASSYGWTDASGHHHPLLTDDERDNLSIRAGTLTASEREVINRHIVSTIQMLEQLPWPAHLRNVPEYAGGHHERMDGKGYPRGLSRDQMSWQARMMGIADIFEALTASDRPYKKAMPVSQALSIMEQFRQNGHIDPDLYQVFLDQEVFLDYARRFLAPEQIDV